MGTPARKRQSFVYKIIGHLTSQNENVETSIGIKRQMINDLRGYPDKLTMYIRNFIQTDRQTIINAAERDLRPDLRRIEQREQAINSNRRQREIEIKKAEETKQQLSEETKRTRAKNAMALTRLTEILGQLDNKLLSEYN